MSTKVRKILGYAVVSIVGVYALAAGITYALMCQSPSTFSGFVASTPGTMAMIVPFKPLWMSARGGSLEVGDLAPDFGLETTDHSQRVQLSNFRGDRPVVLVFGSYT